MISGANRPTTGFAPLVSGTPKILILGSLPSLMSLKLRQYYAHPRNAFWPIMGELFDAGRDHSYLERVHRLAAHHVAVWDVLQFSVRPGSLDSDILDSASEPNDFKEFFTKYPTLHTVGFNGRKAEQMYQRLVVGSLPGQDRFRYLPLPSSSPAHAAMSLPEKLLRWAAVKNAVME